MTDVSQARSPRRDAKAKGGNAFSRFFASIALFVRQVLDEMRKVVYPTRSELWNYTAVVIVFVAMIMAIVSALDFGIIKLVSLIFG